MDSSEKISYYLRKYPMLRVLFGVLIIFFILGSIYIIGKNTKPIPEIYSIEPPVGSPGDVVLITGKNFGNNRDISYVEIAGTKLTASAYISWSDNCIKLVLPANVKDGLVYVGIKDMRSNAALFANEVDIPVPVPAVQQVSKPVIASLSSDKLNTGDLLVIQGSNFGEAKNSSKVLFTIDYNNKIHDSNVKNFAYFTENLIGASDDDFDYVSWSNTEIKVIVPDGVSSGVVIVDTGRERSDPKEIQISENTGTKKYINKKIYLISYSADVADVVCDGSSTITLRAPIPATSAAQSDVQITDISPVPALTNYQHDIIHQITKNKTSTIKNIFNHTFVLPVYEINTSVNVEKVEAFKNIERSLYKTYTASDDLVPCDRSQVQELAKQITGKEKNDYKKALLIYNYFMDNFRLLKDVRKGGSDPLDLIKSEKGDAFDYAVIFTALLRACKIPCLTDCGILIDQDLSVQAHWWNEFYIEGFGWIPVDSALGAGMKYKQWSDFDGDARDYYFGNLDSHHIVFSRGLNYLKPFTADNKIVQQPRSFALQNIWEEASSNISKYSSYWSLPVVKGVY